MAIDPPQPKISLPEVPARLKVPDAASVTIPSFPGLPAASAATTKPGLTLHQGVGVGFFEILGWESTNPEQAAGRLKGAWRVLADVIEPHGGALSLWDNPLALFGTETPDSPERNVQKALFAAQKAQQKLTAQGMSLRLGLSFGDLVVDTTEVGDPTGLGAKVNEAARVLGLLAGAETLVGKHANPPQGARSAVVMSESAFQVLHPGEGVPDWVETHDRVTLKGMVDAQGQNIATGVYAVKPSADWSGVIEMGPRSIPAMKAFAAESTTSTSHWRTLQVLRSDLASYSTISSLVEAEHGPGAVGRLAQWFLGENKKVIARRNGSIPKTLGDEAIGVFGFPSSGTDALDAVQAGQELVETFNRNEVPEEFKPYFRRAYQLAEDAPVHARVRIGVGQGQALVTYREAEASSGERISKPIIIGRPNESPMLRAYDAQNLADVGEVVLDRSVQEQVRETGLQDLMRFDEQGKLFALDTDRAKALRQHHYDFPLIGRTDHYQWLKAALGEAQKAQPQVRVLTGEPGSQRFSVVKNVIQSHADAVLALEARATVYESDPLATALRAQFDAMAFEGSVDQKLDRFLEKVDFNNLPFKTSKPEIFATNQEFLKFVFARLFQLGVSDPLGLAYLKDQPSLFHQWANEAKAIYLDAQTQAGKTIVFSIDRPEKASLAFYESLDRVVGLMANPQVLVAAVAPESFSETDKAEKLKGSSFKVVGKVFEPLAEHEAKAFIKLVLGQEGVRQASLPQEVKLGEIAGRLYERSGGYGNTGYLEQMVRDVCQSSEIASKGWGAFLAQSTQPADSETRTKTGRLLLNRFDALPPAEQGVLRVAAAMAQGGDIWLDGLARASDSFHPSYSRLLAKRHLVRQSSSSLAGYASVSFAAASAPDVIYDTLSVGDKTQTHRAVSDWLRTIDFTHARPAVHSSAAFHAERGEDFKTAFYHFEQAAAKSQSAYQNERAVEYSLKAEEALLKLGQTESLSRTRFDLLAKRVPVARLAQMEEVWKTSVNQMMELTEADALGVEKRAQALREKGIFLVEKPNGQTDYLERARAHFEMLEAEVKANGRSVHDLQAECARLGEVLRRVAYNQDQVERAKQFSEKAEGLARSSGNQVVLAEVLKGAGELALVTRDTQTADAKFTEALDIYKQARNELGMYECYINKGIIPLNEAETTRDVSTYQKADELYKKAQEIAERIGHLKGLGVTAYYRSNILLGQGEIQKGLAKMYRAIDVGERLKLPALMHQPLVKASLYESLENPNQGIRTAGRALEVQQRYGIKTYTMTPHLALGVAHLRAYAQYQNPYDWTVGRQQLAKASEIRAASQGDYLLGNELKWLTENERAAFQALGWGRTRSKAMLGMELRGLKTFQDVGAMEKAPMPALNDFADTPQNRKGGVSEVILGGLPFFVAEYASEWIVGKVTGNNQISQALTQGWGDFFSGNWDGFFDGAAWDQVKNFGALTLGGGLGRQLAIRLGVGAFLTRSISLGAALSAASLRHGHLMSAGELTSGIGGVLVASGTTHSIIRGLQGLGWIARGALAANPLTGLAWFFLPSILEFTLLKGGHAVMEAYSKDKTHLPHVTDGSWGVKDVMQTGLPFDQQFLG